MMQNEGRDLKEIQLTQGKVALVDDEDFERVNQYKWQLRHDGYPARDVYSGGGRANRNEYRYTEYLHNCVMGAKWVDHIDGNPLNNTRDNLRLCTRGQNRSNSAKVSTYRGRPPLSQYKGVTRKKNRWYAQLVHNRKHYSLGYFDREVDAARAYNEAARKYHGEFARLNDLAC
jgi:hypothetical protein